MTGIYKITSPSGKIYIGQTVDFYKRKSAYRNLKCKAQPRLYNSFLKHGFEKHLIEFLENCNLEDLNTKERYYQDLFNVSGKNGLNCMLTRTKDRSGRHLENSKTKMSINSARAMLGKKNSPETRRKISIAKTGVKRSLDFCEKISNIRKGKSLSESHKNNISKAGIGKKMSIESRKNLSEARKGIVFSEKHIDNLKKSHGKKVLDTSTGIEYYSAKYASECLGLNWNTLMARLNGNCINNTTLIYIK